VITIFTGGFKPAMMNFLITAEGKMLVKRV
jgi:hypothetical protein